MNGAASNAIKSKTAFALWDATDTTTAKKTRDCSQWFRECIRRNIKLVSRWRWYPLRQWGWWVIRNVYLVNTTITVNAGDDGINAWIRWSTKVQNHRSKEWRRSWSLAWFIKSVERLLWNLLTMDWMRKTDAESSDGKAQVNNRK